MPSVPDNPGTAPIMMPKQALRVMSSSVTGSDRLERTTHGSNMFISARFIGEASMAGGVSPSLGTYLRRP